MNHKSQNYLDRGTKEEMASVSSEQVQPSRRGMSTHDFGDDHSSLTDHVGYNHDIVSPLESPESTTHSTYSLMELRKVSQLEDSQEAVRAPSLLETPRPMESRGSSAASRGPLSPFSPLFRSHSSNRRESSVSWQPKEATDLSLIPCRTVSVVVRVMVPAHESTQNKPKRICVFPRISNHAAATTATTSSNDVLSPISATMQAASVSEAKDLILVNPSAFGKFIPAEVTMETARLVANVANIESEDWARQYRFDTVVWPSRSMDSDGRSLSETALCKVARSMANDAIQRQQSSICFGLGGTDSGGRTCTLYGIAAKQLAGAAGRHQVVAAERYGMLGLAFEAVLNQLPEDAVCTLSLLEIVDEDTLRDLLATDPVASQSILRIRHPDNKGAIVQNLSDVPLDSLRGLEHLMRRAFHSSAALRARKREGSRGHVLGTIKVWQNGVQYDLGNVARCTSLVFVDVASGEEGNMVDARSARRVASFRKSVSSLRGVLRGRLLRETGESSSHALSYRECTLTKLLQRPLEKEESRAVVVAAVSADSGSYERTLHTLDFAHRLLIRPGKTAQSPFDSAKQRTKSSSAETDDGTLPSQDALLEQFVDKDALLRGVLADPRQRLARIIQKETPSAMASKKLVFDAVESEEEYVPYDYMEIDPGTVNKRYSPSTLLSGVVSGDDEEASGAHLSEGVHQRLNFDGIGPMEHAGGNEASAAEPAGLGSEWSKDIFDTAIRRKLEVDDDDLLSSPVSSSKKEQQVHDGVTTINHSLAKDVVDDDGKSDLVESAEHFQPEDEDYDQSVTDSAESREGSVRDSSLTWEMKDRLDTSDFHLESGGELSPARDNRSMQKEAGKLPPSASSSDHRQNSAIYLRGNSKNTEEFSTSSELSGLEPRRQETAWDEVPEPSDTHRPKWGSAEAKTVTANTDSDVHKEKSLPNPSVREGDWSETGPTHALSVSSASRKSETTGSPHDMSFVSTRSPQEAAKVESYLEDIVNLEGAVDQIKRFHSGIWQSSALSLDRIRRHERSRQLSLELAIRDKTRAEYDIECLQKTLANVRMEYDAARKDFEKEQNSLRDRLNSALSEEAAMERIAEEAIAAEDKLEKELSASHDEVRKHQEELIAARSECKEIQESRKHLSTQLEAASNQLAALQADHSQCQKIIAELKASVESLKLERDKLENFREMHSQKLRDYNNVKAENSSLQSRLKASRDEVARLQHENSNLSNVLEEERNANERQRADDFSRLTLLQEEVSTMTDELGILRQKAECDASEALGKTTRLEQDNARLTEELADAKRNQAESERAAAASADKAQQAESELVRMTDLLKDRDEELICLKTDLATVQDERDRFRYTELKQAMDSLKLKEDMVDKLVREKEELEATLDESDNRLRESTRAALEDLRTQIEEERNARIGAEDNATLLKLRLQDKETELDLALQEIRTLQSSMVEMEEVREKVRTLRLSREQIESEFTNLQSQLEQKQAELESVRNTLDSLAKSERSVKEQLEEESRGRAEFKSSAETLQLRLEETEREMRVVQEQLEEERSSRLQADSDAETRLEQALSELQLIRDELEKTRLLEENLRGQVEEECRLRSDSEASIRTLKSLLESRDAEVALLNQKVESNRFDAQSVDDLKRQLQNEQRVRSSIESSLSTLRDSYAALEEEMSREKADKNRAESMIESLQSQLDSQNNSAGHAGSLGEEQARSEAAHVFAALKNRLQEKEEELESLREEANHLVASQTDLIAALKEAQNDLHHERETKGEEQLRRELDERQKELDLVRARLEASHMSYPNQQGLLHQVEREQNARRQAESDSQILHSRLEERERELDVARAQVDALKSTIDVPSRSRRDDSLQYSEAEELLMREIEAEEHARRRDGAMAQEELEALQQENAVLRLRLTAANNELKKSDTPRCLSLDSDERLSSKLQIESAQRKKAEEVAAAVASRAKTMLERRNEEIVELKIRLSSLADEKESEILRLQSRLRSMERELRWTVSEGRSRGSAFW